MAKGGEKNAFNWGDGHIVTVKRPNLRIIPGGNVICPMPCYPVGETGAEWLRNEKRTRKKIRPLRKNPR